MLPLNQRWTWSSLAPPIFYVAKKLAIKKIEGSPMVKISSIKKLKDLITENWLIEKALTSGNVPCRKRDDQLLRVRALKFWLRYDVLVEGLDGPLEASEFGHRVGDLTAPKWSDWLVESTDAFFSPGWPILPTSFRQYTVLSVQRVFGIYIGKMICTGKRERCW